MKRNSDISLWLAVGGLFSLLIGAWVVLFVLAANHPVASVPLASPAAQTSP